MPACLLAALLWALSPAPARAITMDDVGGPPREAPAGPRLDETRSVIESLNPTAPPAVVDALTEAHRAAQADGTPLPATIVLTDGLAPAPVDELNRAARSHPLAGLGEDTRVLDEIESLTRPRRFERSWELWDRGRTYTAAEDEFVGFGRRVDDAEPRLPFEPELHEQRPPDGRSRIPGPETPPAPAPDHWTLPLPLDGASAPAPSRKEASAVAARAREERRRLSAFWSEPRGLLVRAGGEDYPLTFSLDSELGYADALRAILRHEPSLEKLRAHVDEGGLSPAIDLARELGMSAKQFDRFALRLGAERGKEKYSLTDLAPSHFAVIVKQRFAGTIYQTNHTLRALLDEAAVAMDLPVLASLDSLEKTLPLRPENGSYDVELAHSSWEEVRSVFAALIRRLHSSLVAPQTHLHLGIPSTIGRDATIAVARAVETIMILDLASAPPRNLPEQKFRATTLEREVYRRDDDRHRGLVNLVFEEWKRPHLSNNLELRYHPDIETGLRWLALAAELTLRHRRLIVHPDFDADPGIAVWNYRATTDMITVNLQGALKYASLTLARSDDPAERTIAADLARFSQRMRKEESGNGLFSMGLREEIADYLRSRLVPQRLTADRFLKPAVSARRSAAR